MKTDNELIAENKLIAQFHGSAITREYHKSWELLIMVIRKIDNIHTEKFNYNSEAIKSGKWPKDEEYMDVLSLPINTSKREVFKKLVKFIKWYNQQK